MILNEIVDDENFKIFYNKFLQLQQKAELERDQVTQLDKEDDYGNIEYKLKLANPPMDRVQHLTT